MSSPAFTSVRTRPDPLTASDPGGPFNGQLDRPGHLEQARVQIGAAGGVGRPLAERLLADGHAVSGMHLKPQQGDTVRATGARPVLGDLIEDAAETIAGKMAGHDAVVFSAGAHGTGPDLTTAIDGRGVEKAVAACGIAGILRFVLVSVFMDAGRARERSEGFEHYIAVKRSADVALAASELDWVILRPRGPGQLAGHRASRIGAGDRLRLGAARRRGLGDLDASLPTRDQPCVSGAHGRRAADLEAVAAVVPRRAEV